MYYDDFDTEIQSDEVFDGEFDNLCPHCGTDHGNPDDESACYASQEDEMSGFVPGDDYEEGYNPYTGCRDDDYDDFRYDSMQDESDLHHEW